MAISSVSRIYDAPDPILENDLELLAKVNTFQQAKFDRGAEALQNEIINWSKFADVAKPQDKEYINKKLNNLVNGINNLGGVNLGEVNNVNALKNLGFNIHGDQLILNAVATTTDMRNWEAAKKEALTGKNAKDYDPTVAEWMDRQWDDYLANPEVGVRGSGPTMLPTGNMTMVNKKINDYLDKLKPDAESVPQGDLNGSFQYVQYKGKWLSKSRIQEAINATLDENDKTVLTAHSWKQFAPYSNGDLKSMLVGSYQRDNKIIGDEIKSYEAELALTKDTAKRKQLEQTIAEKKQAMGRNEQELSSIVPLQEFSREQRDLITSGLYTNAWKESLANSRAYREQSQDVTFNRAVFEKYRESRLANQWANEFNLTTQKFAWDMQVDVKQIELKEREVAVKEGESLALGQNNGMGGSSFTTPNNATTGSGNEQKNPDKLIDQSKMNLYESGAGYQGALYQSIAADNPNLFDYNATSGKYVPKKGMESRIATIVTAMENKIDNWHTLTDQERKASGLDADEVSILSSLKYNKGVAKAFYKINREAEDNAFVAAGINQRTADGRTVPGAKDYRDVMVKVGSPNGPEMTVEEAIATYQKSESLNPGKGNKLKNQPVYFLDKATNQWVQRSPLFSVAGKGPFGLMGKAVAESFSPYNFADMFGDVKEIKKVVSKKLTETSGSIFNSYTTPINFAKLNQVAKNQIQTILKDGGLVPADVPIEKVNVTSGRFDYNDETGGVDFFLNIETPTAKGKVEKMSVNVSPYATNTILNRVFPQNNLQLNYMMYLSKTGATPFDANDNYESSMKTRVGGYPFQIVRGKNAVDGTDHFTVRMLYPVGGGKTQVINVKNLVNAGESYKFPASIEDISRYLDQTLSNEAQLKIFKQKHGLQ